MENNSFFTAQILEQINKCSTASQAVLLMAKSVNESNAREANKNKAIVAINKNCNSLPKLQGIAYNFYLANEGNKVI